MLEAGAATVIAKVIGSTTVFISVFEKIRRFLFGSTRRFRFGPESDLSKI